MWPGKAFTKSKSCWNQNRSSEHAITTSSDCSSYAIPVSEIMYYKVDTNCLWEDGWWSHGDNGRKGNMFHSTVSGNVVFGNTVRWVELLCLSSSAAATAASTSPRSVSPEVRSLHYFSSSDQTVSAGQAAFPPTDRPSHELFARVPSLSLGDHQRNVLARIVTCHAIVTNKSLFAIYKTNSVAPIINVGLVQVFQIL